MLLNHNSGTNDMSYTAARSVVKLSRRDRGNCGEEKKIINVRGIAEKIINQD